jgi:hypothetical protein
MEAGKVSETTANCLRRLNKNMNEQACIKQRQFIHYTAIISE